MNPTRWMTTGLLIAAVSAVTLLVSPSHTAAGSEKGAVEQRLLALPLHFENAPDRRPGSGAFVANGAGYGVRISAAELLVQLRKAKGDKSPDGAAGFGLRFIGGNRGASVAGADRLPGVANYLMGNDRAKWRLGQPMFAKVRVPDLYPGIDLIYYGNQRQIEYDFVVAPGADPGQIRLELSGVSRAAVDRAGDLVLAAGGETVRLKQPSVYQEQHGVRRPIAASYRLAPSNVVSFDLAQYDSSKPLVIDPVLVYRTYLGGTGVDVPRSVAVDPLGRVTVVSQVSPGGYPVINALQPVPGSSVDLAVSRTNPEGTALEYSTYLGGSGDDVVGSQAYASNVALDSAGNTYITGATASPDFPTQNSLYPGQCGSTTKAFVTKLNPAGSGLVFATCFPGSGAGSGIAVDRDGNVYLAGQTSSSLFPLLNPVQSSIGGGEDAFVLKLGAGGNTLIYSTVLGGINFENASDVAADLDGNAYLTGVTQSPGFPVSISALISSPQGREDGFFTKLSPSGAMLYSTYLGGSDSDVGYGVATDAYGAAYLTGITFSANFPITAGAYRSTGSPAGFVTKFSRANSLVYSTYLNPATNPRDIKVNSLGQAYITGNDSMFLTKLNYAGSAARFAITLGGGGSVETGGLGLDAFGNVYIGGRTDDRGPGYTTPNALQPNFGGVNDGVIAKVFDDQARFPAIYGTFAIVTNISTAKATIVDLSVEPPVRKAEIAVGAGPFDPAISPDGAFALISSNSAGSVSVIDLTSLPPSVSSTVAVNPQPMGIAISPDGATAVVSHGGSTQVSVLDLSVSPPVVRGVVPVGTGLAGASTEDIAITGDGRYALVCLGAGAAVAVVDLTQNPPVELVANRIVTGSHTVSIGLNPQRTLAAVNLLTVNRTVVLDLTTFPFTVKGSATVGLNPGAKPAISIPGIALTPNADSQTVSVIDAAGPSPAVVATLPVGSDPRGAAIVASGNIGLIANRGDSSGSNSLSRYNLSTLTALPSVPGNVAGFSANRISVFEGPQVAPANLALSVAASPGPILVGANATITATVNNTGPGSAPNATITAGIGAAGTLVSATPSQGTCTGSVAVKCSLGPLANGASATVTLVVQAATSGTLTGSLAAISSAPDPVSSNNSATYSIGITSDATPPVITPGVTPAPNAAGWNNSNPTISWSVSDPESGIGSSTGCATVTQTLETSGITITCSATNGAGTSASASVTIRLDKTVPGMSASRLPVAGGNGWNAQDVTISFICADSLSGLASGSPPAPIVLTTDGTNQSGSGTCFDVAGNSASRTVSGINIDKTPPSISASRSPAANAAGWNNTDVTVTYTCSDALSGLTIDSPPIPAVIVTEGPGQSVTRPCRDNAGNEVFLTVSGVNIDKTLPDLTFGAATPAANANGWRNSAVSIPFTSNDTLSGLPANTPVSPAVLSTEGGGQRASVTITDIAGNSRTFLSPPVSIDLTPPSISGSALTAPNANGWNSTNVTVAFSCVDALAGLAAGSPPANTVLTSEGASQTVNGTCTDNAGNSASAAVSGINIDKTPPVLSLGAPAPAPNAAGWNRTNVTVPFTASDPLSGLSSGAPTSPLVIAAEGAAVSAPVTVSDRAGNVASLVAGPFRIDKTAPSIAGSRSPLPNASGWNTTDVVVSFACTDALSGLASGSPPPPVAVVSEGAAQSAGGACLDIAGNTAATAVAPINIDKTAPSAGAPVFSPSASVLIGTAAGFTATFSDSGSSGLAGASYRVNGGAPVSLGNVSGSSATVTANLGVLSPSGSYVVCVTAQDIAGFAGAPQCATLAVNNAPPVSVPSAADAFILRGQQNQNNGAATGLDVTGDRRSLVQFNQASIAAAVGSLGLASARLRLQIAGSPASWGALGQTLSVHRMTAAWTEPGVTWNCPADTAPANNQANCTPAWDMDQYSAFPYVQTPTAVASMTNGQTGWVEFDVTKDVALFLAGTSANLGWLIRKTDEGTAGTVAFSSREGAAVPELVIIAGTPASPQSPLALSADTYIRGGGAANQTQGYEMILRIQNTGDNRALLRVDQPAIAAAVGTRSLVSAKLRLFIQTNGNNWGASGRQVNAHRMTTAWTEEGATWNCPADTDPSNTALNCPAGWTMGTPALWPFAAAPTSSVTHTNGLAGWVEWDVTADVTAFLGGSAQNHGWVIRKDQETLAGTVEYGSRHSSSAPQLVLVTQ